MRQRNQLGFERYGRITRRAQFLLDMDWMVPWSELAALVEPSGLTGIDWSRQPQRRLERMVRVYFLQQWFNLSDSEVEEALYDSEAMREFAGIDLRLEAAPDEVSVCQFRMLLEQKRRGKKLVATVNEYLRRNGVQIENGTIVDATIIGAVAVPKSALPRSREGKRAS
jgi:IS5 family transposase